MIKIGAQKAVVSEGIDLIACKYAEHGQYREKESQKTDEKTV